MNSNHCQLFTILIGFRTASPKKKICNKINGTKKFIYRNSQVYPCFRCSL